MRRHNAISNFLRGLLIGTADLFPGISGGTIALILGIYERFMRALSSFNKPLLISLFRPGEGKGRRKERIQKLDLLFLLPLLAGIGLAIFAGANGASYLIENHPVIVMSFFLGLLVLSIRLPWRMIKKKDTRSYMSLTAGILVAASISLYGAGSAPSGPAFLVVSGVVASTFMLLPGVSGSSALVILGTYADVIDAVGSLDLTVLLPFILGAGLGVIFITRILAKMLRDHHDITMAALTGLLAGSMVRIWPLRTEAGFAEGLPSIGMEILSTEIMVGITSGVAIMLLSDMAAKVFLKRRADRELPSSDG